MKEWIIIIVILIITIGGYMVIQKYLENSSGKIVAELNDLKDEIKKNDENTNIKEIKDKAEDIYNKWEKIEEKWAIIVFHSELDLIETSFIKMKSQIENEEPLKGLSELETTIFLIEHISGNEKFSLKNIF